MRKVVWSVVVGSMVGLYLLAGALRSGTGRVRLYLRRRQGFQATYGTNSAVLVMGGATYQLPQQVSASGVRYSNGTVTLWTKGQSAFVEENGVITYNNCTTSQSMPGTLPTTGSAAPQITMVGLAAAALLMIGLGVKLRRSAQKA